MSIEISATDAARRFSDILNRVRYRGETFDVVRGGEVVARLTTAADRRPGTAADLLAALGAVGDTDDSFADDLDRIQTDQPTISDDPWDS
jgi:antitoxin (DNA-binding transcriptional repressor) of toxin-antitoxin stability system